MEKMQLNLAVGSKEKIPIALEEGTITPGALVVSKKTTTEGELHFIDEDRNIINLSGTAQGGEGGGGTSGGPEWGTIK